MKISIGALSIAYGLTPEALRYYEDKGLLSPDRNSASGYRRFSISDVQKLGIIKSLQRQGFSLEEIREVTTCCSQERLIAMMDEKRAFKHKEITQARAIYDRLTVGTDLLRDSAGLRMKPRLCAGCAAYLVDFESVAALWEAVPDMPLLKDLIEALPLTSYCTTVSTARLRGENAPVRIGIVAPAEYLAAINADFSQMRMSAGPRCVRVMFELRPPENRTIDAVIHAARDFITAHGLCVVSTAYTRQYTWFVSEHGDQHHIAELIVPVGE